MDDFKIDGNGSQEQQSWLEQKQSWFEERQRQLDAEQRALDEQSRRFHEQQTWHTDTLEPQHPAAHEEPLRPSLIPTTDAHTRNNPTVTAHFASGGESLADVARSRGMRLADLERLNPQIADSSVPLATGQGVLLRSAATAETTSTAASPAYRFVNGGSGPNLDRDYITDQVEAAFAKRGGPPPTQDDINYWVNKASTPDTYSDGRVRIGWNPYWEARLVTGLPAADPRLAGDEGVLVTWRFANGGDGPNLDRGYITAQVEAAFAQRGGPPPTQDEINYWVDKATKPDTYSDGKVRVGWNKYWETRLITGLPAANPALAGEEGVIIDHGIGGQFSTPHGTAHSSSHQYHFLHEPGPNLDRDFITSQVLAAFAQRGGAPPTDEEVTYWVDKATHPDTYSDGKVRLGWNKYWETRLITGLPSANPALAGDEGVLVRNR